MKLFTKLRNYAPVAFIAAGLFLAFTLFSTTVVAQKSNTPEIEIQADVVDLSQFSNKDAVPGTTKDLAELLCAEGSIFSQESETPEGAWSAGNAELSGGYERFQYFDGLTEDITSVAFWGANLYNDGTNWFGCDEDPMEFNFTFYGDDGGAPDVSNVLFTQADVSIDAIPTGELLLGAYEIFRYEYSFETAISITDAWISIQGTGDPDCWFMWMNSPAEGTLSYFDDGTGPAVQETVLSLCLGGGSTSFGEPPVNFMAVAQGDDPYDVYCTWDAPAIGGEWIEWIENINAGAVGLTGGGTFYAAAHWFPEDLTPYDGMSLTKISFFPAGDLSSTFELVVYTGANAGTLVLTQPVTNYTVNEFNEIALDNPVTIDASEDLYFGYKVVHVDGQDPAGRDAGPALANYGDMISLDGVTFLSMSINFGMNWNWNLAGYVVDDGSKSPAIPMVKPTVSEVSNADFSTTDAEELTKKPVVSDSKALLGFNVYNDNGLVGYTTETTYLHEDVENGTYDYWATSVYDEGESTPSNIITVPIGGPTQAFFDNFEAGLSNWEVTGDWGITGEQSYSPSNSLTDSPGGNYLPNLETYATMVNGVDLSDPAILSAEVDWWMIMDIENGNFDYLYVEVSTDDFATFTEIASFFGEGMLDPWMQYTYPLGAFLGNDNVKVRFHFSSDGGYEVDGCYIDDFSILTSDVDDAAPEIFFDEPFAYEGTLGDYTVVAEILDATGVASAEVSYTVDGVEQDDVIGVNTSGDMWEFVIPQQDPGYQVDFVITATDASVGSNMSTTDTASYIAGNYIGYDNAVVDFYTEIGPDGTGGLQGAAVVFTIEDPSQLVYALIRNYTDQSVGENDEMIVHIWSDGGSGPGDDLIDPITIMPEADLVNTRAFTRVDLRPYAAELSGLFGDVFIGFTVPTGVVRTTISQPGIANRSFNSVDGIAWSSITDDYHFRIVTGEAGVNPYPPPENVTAVVEGNDVLVDWDAPNTGGQTGFTDDFESYEDFVLEFAPWTNIDVDGSTTYGFSGIDWPNAYDAQAFILFNPSMTIPATEDIVPHSGDKLAACFAATAPPNDDWLVSPQILVESGDELSFWVKSYTADYGLERYKVGISTTGMDPADFTIVSAGAYLEAPVEDWEEYTYDLSSYAGDDIYVGIQCVSNDAFIFLVDDFTVGSTKSNIAYNSNTAVTGNAVKAINENAVPGKPYTVYGGPGATKSVLEGYNVWRDGEEIAYVEIPTTEYEDMDLAPDTYEYCVTAVYDDGESLEACADEAVTIDPTDPPPAPTNLETEVVDEDIVLTWDAPGNEWIQWDTGENTGNGIGLNGGGTMTVSSHWDPANLVNYNGLTLTQVQFFANGDPDAIYTIKVWTGADGQNEVLSQDVASFNVDEWNVVDLDTPVEIDGTDHLWFGYAVEHGADMFPAGADDGPAIAGYGDMILQGSGWESLVGLNPALDYNWNIAGYVEIGNGGSKLMGKPTTPSTGGTYAALGSTGVTTKMNTAGSKEFQEYKIYYSFDGGSFSLVAETTEATFTHEGGALIVGEHCYEVTAFYNPQGESLPTDEACEVITSVPEFLQNATAVYPNPASDVVNITSDFEIELIRVYNHAGQIVTDQMISSKMYQLNTSEFNPGLYLFQIETTEGTITKRIIIQ